MVTGSLLMVLEKGQQIGLFVTQPIHFIYFKVSLFILRERQHK